MTFLSQIRQAYAEHGAGDLSHLAELILAGGETPDLDQIVREAVAACTTTIELRAALVRVLDTFLPLGGFGHAAVDTALRLLAETKQYRLDRPAPGVPDLGYPLIAHVVATPGLWIPPESVIVLSDDHDVERGVLLLSPTLLAESPHLSARHPYLPIQAIPQGSASPDLIVELWDGVEQLPTLHFSTIWRGVQRSADPATWERVSYPRPQLAMLYNQERLALCPYCLRLHRSPCLVPSPLELAGREE